jgi:hypothetical protein
VTCLCAPAERWPSWNRAPGARPSRRGWANQKHGALRASCYRAPAMIPKYAAVVKSLVRVSYRDVRLVLPS